MTNPYFYGIIPFVIIRGDPDNERDGESGMDECGSRPGADPLPQIAYHLLL